MTASNPPLILLIDDDENLLPPIHQGLQAHLRDQSVIVEAWVPRRNDKIGPEEKLDEYRDRNLVLVITDFDLSKNGMLGFQGPAVQNWCHRNFIPVGDFSRGKIDDLPKEPDLFDIRIPIDHDSHAIETIAAIFTAFQDIRSAIRKRNEDTKSLPSLTAELLGKPELEPDLSLYFTRLVTSNTAVRQRLQQIAEEHIDQTQQANALITYIIAHVLSNLIIAFPGPILGREVIAAYLGTTMEGADKFIAAAALPRYDGPFSKLEDFYWRSDVDAALEGASLADSADDPLLYGRDSANEIVGEALPPHGCTRTGCYGLRGGFWCPFQRRPVCLNSDCSRATSAWLPDGADMCRVEAEFFDELGPLLGR